MASQSRRSLGRQSSRDQRQPTLSEHIASSELKRSAEELSPTSKRRKLDLAEKGLHTRITSNSMYSFGTPDSGPIDLTASPSPSPRARRVSGATPLSVKNGLNTPSFGAKKLVVKNLRRTPKSDPDNYCYKTTEQLDAALTAIFIGERPALSNEELYRGVENVCKLGKAADLAKRLENRCKGHVAGTVKERLAGNANSKNTQVLREVVAAWKTWERQFVGSIISLGRRQLMRIIDNYSIHFLLPRPFVSSLNIQPFNLRLRNTKLSDICLRRFLAGRKSSGRGLRVDSE